LEKASKINSVDIGNNGSAFVEVLVGRSSSSEYQVLLVASSFMSPAESKSGTNNNRVRMFGLEKLSKVIADQKWDRVKLSCTQPYTKTSCYGLSFVNFHTPESTVKNGTPEK
ncbi:DNA repair XRCC1-like, partial [Paramuricea clavata]